MSRDESEQEAVKIINNLQANDNFSLRKDVPEEIVEFIKKEFVYLFVIPISTKFIPDTEGMILIKYKEL
jgi:hypothetical protein